MKTDPRARYQGYTFFFKEGFCWNNVLNPQARLLKAKMKSASINDVGAMSLSSIIAQLPNYYFVSILNSELLFNYYRTFVNCSVNIQINDIRLLPVVVPSDAVLGQIKPLFLEAVSIKAEEAKRYANIEERNSRLEEIESAINGIVNMLYGLADIEIIN